LTKGPLPPEAWLLESHWGRDIVHYANDEDERISVANELEWAGIEAEPQTIVTMALVKNAKTVNNGARKVADKLDTYRRVGAEGLVSMGLFAYLIDGRRSYSFGSDEQRRFLEAPDPVVGDLIRGDDKTFYASLPEPIGKTSEGAAVDGFLIVTTIPNDDDLNCDDDTGGTSEENEAALLVYPMSRIYPRGESYGIYPLHRIPLSDPTRPVKDCLLDWAESYDRWFTSMEESWREDEADHEYGEDRRFADPHDLEQIKTSVVAAQGQVLREMRERSDTVEKNMTGHAEEWAKLIAGILATVNDPDASSTERYVSGAPDGLVAKALAKKTGYRKAEQKLASQGYRAIRHYERNSDGQWQGSCDSPDTRDHANAPAAADMEAAPAVSDAAEPKDRRQQRIDPRKKKRKARTVVHAAAATGSDRIMEEAEVIGKREEKVSPSPVLPDSQAAGHVTSGTQVLKEAEELLRRSLRDAPEAGTRNWRNAMASAFAGLIVRRVKVVTMPRESDDSLRKRLSVGIADRLCGLDEAQTDTQEAQRRSGIQAHLLTRVSTLRAIDPDVAPDDGQVRLIEISDCHEIAKHIAFPGVEPGNGHEHAGNCRVLLRFLRDEMELHIEGFAYEGCLIGYRKVVLNMADGQVREADTQSSTNDPEEYADMAYAALCDVILGPVDEIDAWQWEIDYERYRNRTSAETEPEQEEAQPSHVIEDLQPSFEAITTKAATPVMSTFHSWHNLTMDKDGPDIDPEDIRTLSLLSQDNAVATNFAHMIRHDDAAPPEIMMAWRRFACSIARSNDPVFTKIDSPRIRDDVDLQPLIDTEGVVILRDTAFLDNAHDNLIPGGEVAKARAFCIYYRIHLDGFSALVMQDDGADSLSFATWTRGQVRDVEDESELAWYLRGALWQALRTDTPSDEEPVSTCLPAIERRTIREVSGFRQGPKRVIAQVRMRPSNMAIALRTVSEWFDEQVERHGDNLVADLREQGDWTIEHSSTDRGVESLWSVSVLTPQTDPNCVDIVVQTTLATGVKPRLPTIVRRIAAATPTEGPDGLLRVRPSYVTTKGDVLELIRDLQSEDRTLPILLMTQDERGEYLRDPAEIAQQGLGALTVKTLAHSMTYELTDRLGQEYRTFGGAVRLFQPGFDPDRDTASRHPRIMPDTMADRTLAALISRATGGTVTRYDIPEAVRPERGPAPSILTLPSERQEQASLEASVEDPIPVAPERKVDPKEDLQTDVEVPTEEKGQRGTEDNDGTPVPLVAKREDALPSEDEDGEVSASGEDGTAGESDDDNIPRATYAPVATIDEDLISSIVGRTLDERLASLGLTTLKQDLKAMLSEVAAAAPVPTSDDKDKLIQTLREELRVERESSVQLLDEADAERRSALMEVDTLRQALNDRRRTANGKKKTDYPADLTGLGNWIDQNVLPNVVITSKAWRSMRNVDYRDMERLCETLKLLDGPYVDMRAGEDGAREQWQEGLQRLRLEDKKQTRMGRAARESDYQFTHEGETWVVDRHLRGNESLHNDHSRLLRIYYSWDADRARVLICSMPRHAHTRDS